MCSCIVVVPCYQEERRLDVAAFRDFFETRPEVGFCFVDDGSEDATASVLEALAADRPQVTTLALGNNQGKAEAVRQGIIHVLENRGADLVGYWDADLATPLRELPALIEPFRDPRLVMVAGSRIRRLGSRIVRSAHRHFLGRIFATFASFVLGLPTYDTQCGAKVLRASIADRVFRTPFCSRWIFDVEVFARIVQIVGRERAAEAFLEVPLTSWEDVGASRLRLRDFLVAPAELFRLARTYRRSGSEPAPRA